MNVKKLIAAGLAAGMLLAASPLMAEEADSAAIVDTQKLGALRLVAGQRAVLLLQPGDHVLAAAHDVAEHPGDGDNDGDGDNPPKT